MQKVEIDSLYKAIEENQSKQKILFFDAHNIVYRTIHSAAKEMENVEKGYYSGQLDSKWDKKQLYSYWKHLVINSFFSFIKDKNPNKVIFAFDSSDEKQKLWRKDFYSKYKSTRASKRSKSKVDFDEFFPILNEFIVEFRALFTNFYVLRIDKCEADDVIAVLVKYFSQDKNNSIELISTDSDYTQLQIYDNFKQFDPNTLTYKKSINPLKDLEIKILSGDDSDDIPGVKDRCGPKTAMKMIDEGLDSILEDETIKQNYMRNRTLIDFEYIPKDISNSIVNTYVNYEVMELEPNKISEWFVKNKLNKLNESWQFTHSSLKKIL